MFLLRAEIPDVPGSLGTLAAAIGAAGANIEAIEIIEHGYDGIAIDDVLLDVPPYVMPDAVVSACHAVDGVRVLWISRYAAGASLSLDLETLEAVTADPPRALVTLVEQIPHTFRTDWAAWLQVDGDRVGVKAASPAAPDLDTATADWLVEEQSRRLEPPDDSDGWRNTLLVGVPLDGIPAMVVAGRHGGPEFLDSELARITHLTGLAASVQRAVRRVPR